MPEGAADDAALKTRHVRQSQRRVRTVGGVVLHRNVLKPKIKVGLRDEKAWRTSARTAGTEARSCFHTRATEERLLCGYETRWWRGTAMAAANLGTRGVGYWLGSAATAATAAPAPPATASASPPPATATASATPTASPTTATSPTASASGRAGF